MLLKATEIHSSPSEKQRWWARSRVTAAWEAAGLSPVISEALWHTDTLEHGHLDSLLSWREASLQWFHPLLLPEGRRKASTQNVCHATSRLIFQMGNHLNNNNKNKLDASFHRAPVL